MRKTLILWGLKRYRKFNSIKKQVKNRCNNVYGCICKYIYNTQKNMKQSNNL